MLDFSHLRKMPRHLLHVGHPVTVDELRDAADLIVDYAASVFPRASQRTQEELSIFGVTSQLWENTKGAHVCSSDGYRGWDEHILISYRSNLDTVHWDAQKKHDIQF